MLSGWCEANYHEAVEMSLLLVDLSPLNKLI